MIKVVFLGTPQIAVNSIMKLLNFADIHIVGIVTQPDRPAGRGKKLVPPPVKVCGEANGIPVFQTSSIRKDAELIQKLIDMEPDFFVTFAFGQILSQEVLDIPKVATVNLHASLLPKYRGANPIQRCIYNGDEETGISTMITVLGLDAGDVCLSEKIHISIDMTNLDLVAQISDKAPFLIYRTLKGLYSNTLIPVAQDESLVTFADKFTKEDGVIDWNKKSLDIHNQVRSMVDWPCAVTEYEGKKIKILRTSIFDLDSNYNSYIPGEVISIEKNGVVVRTLDGSLLVEKVKPESKGEMDAKAWSNGVKLQKGSKFN